MSCPRWSIAFWIVASACGASPSTGDDTDAASAVADGDGDGIPDHLEVEGFVVRRGKIVAWDGDPLVPHFFTDPTKASTDGDPYPDGMEATGRGMDPTVTAPGNHPLVAAMPQIVAVLQGYSVIPMSEVTLADGGSIASGHEVEESTTKTTSRTREDSWEAGASVEVKGSVGVTWAGTPKGSASVEVSGYFTTDTTDTTTEGASSARRSGVSSSESANWSHATSTSEAQAARLKLDVRIVNRGTATATDVLPTFGLRIGDRDVATFDPPTDVLSLRPGESYPGAGSWVLDADEAGNDLTVTLDELRMLQTGAPLTLTVNQVSSTVVVPDGLDWTGDTSWDVYSENIRPISSRLLADDGKGGFAEARVFSDAGGDAPTTTLGDAMAVAFGIRPSNEGDTTIDLYTDDGTLRRTPVDGWRVALDPETWEAHKDELTAAGGNPMDLQLKPGMTVRVVPPPASGDTAVHFARWAAGAGNTRDLEVAVSDLGFEASTLEVTATIPTVGEVPLSWNQATGLFRARGVNLSVGTLLGGLTEISARNPEQVEHDEDGATLDVGSSLAFLSRLGGHFTPTVQQTVGSVLTDWSFAGTYYSTSLNLRTVAGGEALPPATTYGSKPATWPLDAGLRLAVVSGTEEWFLQLNESTPGGGWCLLSASTDIETLERADLDGCAWGSVQGTLHGAPVPVDVYVPDQIMAIRFANSGAGSPDRVLLVDLKSPASGSGFLRPGDVDVPFDAYLFAY